MPLLTDAPSADSMIIVITGANKGIGKAIVKQIVLQAPSYWKDAQRDVTLYLTSRNTELGEKAIEDLKPQLSSAPLNFRLQHHPLDIGSEESIKTFKKALEEKHGGIDILVNNAGIASKGPAFDYDIVKWTLETNYYGTLKMMENMLPLMRKEGRVINVSSMIGKLSQLSEPLQKKFLDPNLKVSDVTELMESFTNAVKEGNFKELGWSNSAYGVSKVGMTALSKVFAHDQRRASDGKNLLILSCHPGYVNTDMTSGMGHLTVDQGAETPVFLSLAPLKDIVGTYTDEQFDKGFGVYWSDKKAEQW
ncbi:hypothetical protein DSO57_1004514 [Entomophthora muscae]|uniref:Uncharacterized protein n=1 Tax=Entomophthora muscae TaxID=34485 RepID=A0ACC2RN41_9FUNG|nr:hypothetical protein DSO57_1004514 [Entomophthora muscae]